MLAVRPTLVAHRLSFSRLVLVSALARVIVQSALLPGLVLVFHVRGELACAPIVCCSLPVGMLLASRFGTLEKELPAVLLTTVALVAALPAWFALTGWLLPP